MSKFKSTFDTASGAGGGRRRSRPPPSLSSAKPKPAPPSAARQFIRAPGSSSGSNGGFRVVRAGSAASGPKPPAGWSGKPTATPLDAALDRLDVSVGSVSSSSPTTLVTTTSTATTGATAAGGGPRSPKVRALREPKIAPRSRGSFKRQRPSLSEQLARIGDAAGAVTAGLADRHGLGDKARPPLMSAPAAGYVVGRLESKVATPIRFFGDKCVYVFNHPFERKQITMEMFYRDMAAVRCGKRALRYKVRRPLAAFGSDYDHNNATHELVVSLGSEHDMQELRTKVLPKIRLQAAAT